VPRIVKDCFGTVISTLTKMKECVRCELLSECRSINWTAPEGDSASPVVLRRSGHAGEGADADPDAAVKAGKGAGPATQESEGDAAGQRH
jgi:hypothetical protein